MRTTGDSPAVVPLLRKVVTATNPQARIDLVMTMEARLNLYVETPASCLTLNPMSFYRSDARGERRAPSSSSSRSISGHRLPVFE